MHRKCTHRHCLSDGAAMVLGALQPARAASSFFIPLFFHRDESVALVSEPHGEAEQAHAEQTES
jgi:hypothetical protein